MKCEELEDELLTLGENRYTDSLLKQLENLEYITKQLKEKYHYV